MFIAFDLETYMIKDEGTPPKPVCISWAGETLKEGIAGNIEPSLPFGLGKGDGVFLVSKYLLNRAVEGDILVLANAKFDLLVLHHYYPSLRPLIYKVLELKRIYDVQIIEKLLMLSTKGSISGKFNLASLILKYLEIDVSGDKREGSVRTRYSEYDLIPTKFWDQDFIDYAVNDSVYTLRVVIEQMRVKKPLGYSSANTHENMVQMDFCLGLMTQEGLEVDQERAISLKRDLDSKIGPLRNELIRLGFASNKFKDVEKVEGLLLKKRELLEKLILKGDEEKISKAKEMIEKYILRIEAYKKHNLDERKVYSFDSKKFREYLQAYYPTYVTYGDVTPSGQRNVKINEFSLGVYPSDPVIDTRKNLTLYEKYRSTYVPMFEGKERINPRYNLPKNTGRTSSTIHLWPRDGGIRSVIKAEEGYKFLVIDYAGLELCTFSQACFDLFGYSKLGEWLNSGDYPPDAHGLVTYALYKDDTRNPVSFEEFITWKSHEDEELRETYKRYRTPAKEVGLGYPGGRGHDSIHQKMNLLGIKISLKEAINQRKVHAEAMPEIIDFLGNRKAFGSRFKGIKGWVQKQFIGSSQGEDQFSYSSGGRFRNNTTFCATANGRGMQSDASNGAVKAVFNLTRECYDPTLKSVLFGSRPCWFIHDEVSLKVKDEDISDELIERANYILIDGMQEITPCVRITTEGGIMKYWEKDEASWERVDKFFKNPLKEVEKEISPKSAYWR